MNLTRILLTTVSTLFILNQSCVAETNSKEAKPSQEEILQQHLKESLAVRDPDTGRSILLSTAAEGNTGFCEGLLGLGGDINAVSDMGETALYLAIDNGHIETAQMLISKGADVNIPAASGETPLQLASKAGYSSMPPKPGKPSPKLANKKDYATLITQLIEAGADVNQANLFGWTPLCYASTSNIDIIKILLNAGADVNIKTIAGKETPLHFMARHDQPEAVQLLIERGADINATAGDYSQTPLHYAAQEGQKSVTLALIKAGADVNAQDFYGSTPLHYAAQYGCQDVAVALVDAGADVTALNKNGEIPAQLAAQNNHQDLARYLRKVMESQ